jgi:hypothetical protein
VAELNAARVPHLIICQVWRESQGVTTQFLHPSRFSYVIHNLIIELKTRNPLKFSTTTVKMVIYI